MVLPKLKRHLNAKKTKSGHDIVHGHRNLNYTERVRSAIARHRNFNAPKFCKITVAQCISFGQREMFASIESLVACPCCSPHRCDGRIMTMTMHSACCPVHIHDDERSFLEICTSVLWLKCALGFSCQPVQLVAVGKRLT